jgi:hypothetical protein
MIRVFQMIFAPEGVWHKIAEENRNFLFVLFLSTLPLVVGALAVEGAGILQLGERTTEFGKALVSQDRVIRYETAQLVLTLGFLFFGTWMLKGLAESFHAPVTFSQTFNTLAYGASPIFLMRALDGLPAVNTWVCWGVGVALAIRAFYHGVAISLKPEQTKGFGLYIITVFLVAFLTALPHFVAVSILHQKIWK